jgi:hypothetical protein
MIGHTGRKGWQLSLGLATVLPSETNRETHQKTYKHNKEKNTEEQNTERLEMPYQQFYKKKLLLINILGDVF